MERIAIGQAKELFGSHFIGWDELKPLLEKLGLSLSSIRIPDIHYTLDDLEKKSKDYILGIVV